MLISRIKMFGDWCRLQTIFIFPHPEFVMKRVVDFHVKRIDYSLGNYYTQNMMVIVVLFYYVFIVGPILFNLIFTSKKK